MRRLSGTDSLFLAGETPAWHQHVAGLTILDPRDAPDFGFEALMRTVGERLPLVPKLTWKLKSAPLGLDRAVWIDDTEFDLTPPHPAHGRPRSGRSARDGRGDRTDPERSARPPLSALGAVVPRRDDQRPRRRGDEVPSLPARRRRGQRARGAAARPRTGSATAVHHPMPASWSRHRATCGCSSAASRRFATTPVRAVGYAARLARRGIDLGRYVVSRRPKPDMGAMLQAPRTSFNAPISPRRDRVQQRGARRREGAAPPLRREGERHRARALLGRTARVPARARRAPGALDHRRHPGLDSRRRRHRARQPAVVHRGTARDRCRRPGRARAHHRPAHPRGQRGARGPAGAPGRLDRRDRAAVRARRRCCASRTRRTCCRTCRG